MTTTTETLEAYQSGKILDCDPGVYPATVSDVETVDGEFGEQVRLTFTLDNDPDTSPYAWASRKLGTATKLWKWVTALRGTPPQIGERFALHDLIGLKCQVVIGAKKTKSGDEVLGVTDVLPAKRQKAPGVPHPLTSAPAPTPAPADLADVCFCGSQVAAYSPTGQPLCERHAGELADAN
jgi:hypothetical protein